MERGLLTLSKGANCSAWNYCGERLAVGSTDGTVSIFDTEEHDGASSNFTCTSNWMAHGRGIVKIVWVPPEYGDAIACICDDGTLSLWEEVEDGTQTLEWKLCNLFEGNAVQALDLQFGNCISSLKLAEFQNVTDSVSRFEKPLCLSGSIAWNPQRNESRKSTFVLGFSSNLPQFNSSKIWEFDEAHQRWQLVAELALPEDTGDGVQAVAWAPNIGRPYEVIAVATSKGIAIWHVCLYPDTDGRPLVKKVALLAGHDGEVWQLEWDMCGLTLASTGSDTVVRLWQSNLNGVWHEQATIESS